MARPLKNTVEYFPHFVKSGRTVFILESRFGNDGYAFWFKLLEILGESEGHSYDCSDTPSWAYLVSKARVTDEQAEEIISLLVEMGNIDRELWEERRVIWVENFVRNLFGLYKMRHAELPLRPEFSSEKPEGVGVFIGETPEGCELIQEETPRGNYPLVKESKVKESKGKERDIESSEASPSAPTSPVVPYGKIGELWNSICTAYPKVVKVTDKRKTKIRLRLEEFACGSAEETLAAVEELFRRVQASSFLRGDNNRGWQASFDWLFENGSNWVKVTEGNYDNRGGYHPAGTTGGAPVTARLGVGEYIDPTGRRTYGTGQATIPDAAPARPSERHYWNSSTQQWALL